MLYPRDVAPPPLPSLGWVVPTINTRTTVPYNGHTTLYNPKQPKSIQRRRHHVERQLNHPRCDVVPPLHVRGEGPGVRRPLPLRQRREPAIRVGATLKPALSLSKGGRPAPGPWVRQPLSAMRKEPATRVGATLKPALSLSKGGRPRVLHPLSVYGERVRERGCPSRPPLHVMWRGVRGEAA